MRITVVMLKPMSEVTRILSAVEQGDPHAAEQLLPLVYDELRKLAAARMADEKSDHTLQPTGLVHEAYLRLVGADAAPHWNGRGHFFAAAAEAMRRILVECARRRITRKRGGQEQQVPLEESTVAAPVPDEDVLAVHEALDDLARLDAKAAALVKLRFFVGLTAVEAAKVLDMSTRSAHDLWAYARSWLHQHIHREF